MFSRKKINLKLNVLKTNRHGSILFNVMISFSIIALLATISIPYIKKYQPNLKLNAAGRDLTSDLRYAQQLAITEQITYSVQADFLNDRYEIIKNSATPETIKTVIFDPEISFQQITGLTADTATFNSYGGLTESGAMVLVNTNGKTMTINIKPSGYVQLVQ